MSPSQAATPMSLQRFIKMLAVSSAIRHWVIVSFFVLIGDCFERMMKTISIFCYFFVSIPILWDAVVCLLMSEFAWVKFGAQLSSQYSQTFLISVLILFMSNWKSQFLLFTTILLSSASHEHQHLHFHLNNTYDEELIIYEAEREGFDSYPYELKAIFQSNNKQVQKLLEEDPQYFSKHCKAQSPKYLWFGCSDSRVIPESIIGADIGEVFVHRNVANQVNQFDTNAMTVLQYAIEYLGVENIIVSGHYGCGGIRASLSDRHFGPLQAWLAQIRQIRYRHHQELSQIEQDEERLKKLVQINVEEQVRRVYRLPIVQLTWRQGKPLNIFGLVYDLKTGTLINVSKPVRGLEDIPDHEEFAYDDDE